MPEELTVITPEEMTKLLKMREKMNPEDFKEDDSEVFVFVTSDPDILEAAKERGGKLSQAEIEWLQTKRLKRDKNERSTD